MKEIWYGDNRDLVKWGALVDLAERERIDCLVQALYLRSDHIPALERDGSEIDLVEIVWRHFRSIDGIRQLKVEWPRRIELFDDDYEPGSRQGYTDRLIAFFRTMARRKIVFLDPDTGIEPKHLKPEHVSLDEIRQIWAALAGGDWLAVYQHAPLAIPKAEQGTWHHKPAQRLSDACGGAKISTYTGPRLARDVAILLAQKPS